jgi:hypothetical protein
VPCGIGSGGNGSGNCGSAGVVPATRTAISRQTLRSIPFFLIVVVTEEGGARPVSAAQHPRIAENTRLDPTPITKRRRRAAAPKRAAIRAPIAALIKGVPALSGESLPLDFSRIVALRSARHQRWVGPYALRFERAPWRARGAAATLVAARLGLKLKSGCRVAPND